MLNMGLSYLELILSTLWKRVTDVYFPLKMGVYLYRPSPRIYASVYKSKPQIQTKSKF